MAHDAGRCPSCASVREGFAERLTLRGIQCDDPWHDADNPKAAIGKAGGGAKAATVEGRERPVEAAGIASSSAEAAEPSPARQPSESLAEEVERRLRAAVWKVPGDKLVKIESVYLPCAVSVAVEMIERERKATFGEHTLAVEWQGRAEVAEKELEGLRAFMRRVDEALNSGDGVYRP